MNKSFFKAVLMPLIMNILLMADVYASDSVLSSGTWYKLSVTNTGMFSLTYSDLSAMGIDVNNIDPRNIRLFHNGGGLLPIYNRDERPVDLVEIPIIIYGEDDGHFNDGDMIVFYARGPMTWTWNKDNNFYQHVKNPYSDNAYVFMTIGDVHGKRIEYAEETAESSKVVTDFLDVIVYDKDEYNLNNMGATWYFDRFDVTLSRTYEFGFPDIVTSKKARLLSEVAVRTQSPASFKYEVGGETVANLSVSAMASFQYEYAKSASTYVKSFTPESDNLDLTLTFTRNNSASIGWINYIEMNAWRRLRMSNDVVRFRNPECYDLEYGCEYRISDATSSTMVWDVTVPTCPRMMKTTMNGSTMSFKSPGKDGSEYVAFNGNSFSKAEYIGVVSNQNLHAKKDIDYLIVTHPMFMNQAKRLKEIHSRLDDLVIDIVEPQTIYNEFSCGAQDVYAIRDYIKMLYDNSSEEHRLKYVLLFGDASYAYKNPEVCLVPTYEWKYSLSLISSRVSDDVYVCLGPDDGNIEGRSKIDLPIGRMPVSTVQQAEEIVDKIEAFVDKNELTMQRWRNMLTLVCDDGENGGNSFLYNCETIAGRLREWGGEMIADKIYLDAYQQVATSSGQRCPEVNEAITNRIESGTLMLTYIGHGGETGLAEERIMTNDNINSWKNLPMLPIFVTATCEFSRFDDHTRTSAGELVFLNPNGGAINMITTARTTQGGDSMGLLLRMFESMFKMYGGEYQCIGDIFKDAKQDEKDNTKVYVLFGDPALRLAYPKNNVVLKKINGNSVDDAVRDTIKALAHVELDGEVQDNFGCVMEDFNGTVNLMVYDKENTYVTKGDHGVDPVEFKIRNSVVFNGNAVVDSGRFHVEFTVPKDIKYNYGRGLISFYATSYDTDANGIFDDIMVGGYDTTATPDSIGPEVRLYIDDTLFVNGGITNESPVLIAKIRDENGINMTGSAIGHDITAVVSGATNKTYNLNNYYNAPLKVGEYGDLSYILYDLNEGEHNLRLRVWDVYNNSTVVSLNFTVVKGSDGTLAIDNLINVPNPMVNETRIMFEHNQKSDFDVLVRIYNLNGQLVKTISESRAGESMRVSPIYWNGTNDNGISMPSGLYVYNVTVSNGKNETVTGFSKLVIAR